MFGWAITFLVVAIVGGTFGFAAAAGTTAWVAKALFFAGVLALLVLLAMSRRQPTV
jgi:uncharacterized membrane protein YtjA (UPF0391 family)